MKKNYEAIIVGGGPAGLFAAYELQRKGIKKVLVIDKGKSSFTRTPKDVMWGVGGAGLFSDGKLNFTPVLGKTDITEFLEIQQAGKLIDEVEEIFKKFGMDGEIYPSDMAAAKRYRSTAKKLGMDLQIIKQKHLGSDKLPGYIQGMETFLKKGGVDFVFEEEVREVLMVNNKLTGVATDKNKYYGRQVILGPGRSGNHWLSRELARLGVKNDYGPIEVGVRVEAAAEVLEEICSIIYDPTFYFYSDTFDDKMRTFCTNRTGYVATEYYKEFVCVNGHSYSEKKSENANFALLNKISLSEPVTDTVNYGESICKLAATIGGGKPILQRYGDLRRHRRSTERRLAKSYVKPTLGEVTPGDISMALPARVIANLMDGLERLDKIMPGLASDSTLLYAPEVKFFSVRPKVSNNLETEIKGLFVAGDGAGVSGNIVGAAATGIIAARGLAKRITNKTVVGGMKPKKAIKIK